MTPATEHLARGLHRTPLRSARRDEALDSNRAEFDRRLFNRLTSIRLAIQILERKTELSDYQRKLAQTAIESADDLTVDLLEERQRLRSLEQPTPQFKTRWFIPSQSPAIRSTIAGLVWGVLAPLGWRALTGLGRQLLQPRMVGTRATGRSWMDLRLKPRRK